MFFLLLFGLALLSRENAAVGFWGGGVSRELAGSRVLFTGKEKNTQLTTSQKEFEAIMANRQVVARLNELESLVADATRRRLEAPDPTSPPVPYALPSFSSFPTHH